MDWLASDQRERESTSAVPAKSGVGDEHRVKHYPWWISFPPFLFGFSEPFPPKNLCNLASQLKGFLIFLKVFYFIAFLMSDMNCQQILHFTPPH